MLNLKLYISFVCLCLIAASSTSYVIAQEKTTVNTGIVFSSKEYKQVLAEAKATHKKIFVDAYATWCAPCKQLQKTTFKDHKAASYYNKNFINISVDVEKGNGIGLAEKWNIEGLPTLLILDENGKTIADHVGFVDGNGLLEFAKEASRL
jgi:thiol:disulfide interchange protein